MDFRELRDDEITIPLFQPFDRYQKVTHCWRKIDGQWVIKEVPFIEQWDINDYDELVGLLKNTVITHGVVFGAFSNGLLKGFSSVESIPIGSKCEYLVLSNIYVSSDTRGKGVGKKLFKMASIWAKEHGAAKLYISAHSSVESQLFYKAMGCVEAMEYDKQHVEKEPCDCQLECIL